VEKQTKTNKNILFAVAIKKIPVHLSARVGYLLCTLFIAVLFFYFHAAPVHATGGLNELNYQGRLLNAQGAIVPDGLYNMEFKIYSGGTGCVSGGSSPCGGTLLWTEDWTTSTAQVTVKNGYFSVSLGANNPFGTSINWNTSTLWLSVNIGGTGSTPSWDGEMTPFQLLTSSPYAMNSGELGGLASSSFGQLSANQTWTGSNVFEPTSSTSAVQVLQSTTNATVLDVDTVNGQLGVGTATPSATLDVYNGNEQLDYGGIKFNELSAPSAPTVAVNATSGNLNSTYYYTVAFVSANGQTAYGTVSSAVSPASQQVNLTNIPTGTSGVVTARKIYRTKAGGSTAGPFYLVATIADDTTTSYTDNIADASLGAAASDINTSEGAGQLQIAGITMLQADPASGNLALGTTYANNSTGIDDVALGAGALNDNTTGDYNFALGANALYGNQGGSSDVAIGVSALGNVVSSGSGNVAIGQYAAANLGGTVDNSNTVIGYDSGTNLTTNNANNLIIGANIAGPSGGASNYLNIGNVLFGSTSTGSAYFENSTNSTSAFQIENSSAQPIFLVDTTTNNLVKNPGFETGTTGWACTGTCTGGLIQNTTKSNVYAGQASLEIVLGAASSGANTSTFTTSTPAGSYELSFYASASASLSGLTASLGTGTCTLNATTVSASGFERYYCSVTTTSASPTITITVSTASGTLYLDSVQLTSGSSLTPYQIGNIQLRGIVDSPAVFDSVSNSQTALQVTTSSGSSLLTVDTLDGYVTIGSSTPNTNTALLLLDNYSTGGSNPTGVVGAMYYNSGNETFQCDEGQRGWQSCLGIPKPNTRRWAYIIDPGGTATTFGAVGDIATLTTTGTVAGTAATTTAPAMVSQPTSTTSGAVSDVVGNIQYNSSSYPDFQTYIKTGSAITSTRIWSGLTSTTPATMGASATPTAYYAAFRYDTSASDTKFECVYNNNGTATAVASSITVAASTGYKLEVIVGPSTLDFKINGSDVCGSPISFTMTANELLGYINSITTLSTTAVTLSTAWIYIDSNF
jgi:hypothetical protein